MDVVTTTVTRERGDSPVALALVAAMVDELHVLYGGPGKGPTATPEELSPPGGAYVVMWEADRPVAGGGVKRLSDDMAEIKRMFVVPEARGLKLGSRILDALEAAAKAEGVRIVRLETGARQPPSASTAAMVTPNAARSVPTRPIRSASSSRSGSGDGSPGV